jgi:hypothetical protein
MTPLEIIVSTIIVYTLVRLGCALAFNYLRRRDEKKRQELDDELRREDGCDSSDMQGYPG